MTGISDEFPTGHADERELYLAWLAYLRGAVLRKLHGSRTGPTCDGCCST